MQCGLKLRDRLLERGIALKSDALEIGQADRRHRMIGWWRPAAAAAEAASASPATWAGHAPFGAIIEGIEGIDGIDGIDRADDSAPCPPSR